jgi:glutamate-5-semialdehyde dehydrogenase
LLEANRDDVAQATRSGHDAAFIDRLTLSAKAVEQMAQGLEEVAALADPVGRIEELVPASERNRGRAHARAARRHRHHLRVPAERHCGCGGPLPQGRQRLHPARRHRGAAFEPGDRGLRARGLRSAGLPEDAVQVVATTDRAAVGELISMPEYVDIIVPRGGKELIARLARESRIPMIKHLDGVLPRLHR